MIECVNRVFDQPELRARMPGFETHATFHESLWGRVELLPLIQPVATEEATPPTASTLRDPLTRPRELALDERYYLEGRQAAERIQTLIASGCRLGEGDAARPARYGDILILLRSRTHAADYERALRDAGIPCLGTSRGALLDSLEARDLEALLQTLIAPHDNLALAQVLRSPLFAADDHDLIRLAERKQGDWMARLAALAEDPTTPATLRRAADCLPRWRERVGRLPVHDLLDRVFFEGDVLDRYAAATPEALRPQVLANLQRFLELALEIDSGRYPSLPRFLQQLTRLRERSDEAPDDAPPAAGDRVRLLTIHGAKGLEAPVVFLLDAAAAGRDRSAWQALVDWPASEPHPAYFLLNPGQARRDSVSRDWQAAQQQAEAREDANLLYVALTRARQLLIVSGSAPARGSGTGWYGLIRNGLASGGDPSDPLPVLESGSPPAAPATAPATARPEAPAPDPRLARPLELALPRDRLAPSRRNEVVADSGHFDADGRLRGQAVHLLLEWLSEPAAVTEDVALRRLAAWAGRDATEADLQAWLAEAREVLDQPELAGLFDPSRYEQAWKEVPLQYLDGTVLVEGIVDRLVRYPDRLCLIDYKSHRLGTRAGRAACGFLPGPDALLCRRRTAPVAAAAGRMRYPLHPFARAGDAGPRLMLRILRIPQVGSARRA
ncbi:UvrD-helicase domain-containing protein [Thiohalobacter thiocyanaticus]|uniref:UvrD-helicase domain-containing protein n=1 Tax=Thiohalobacter thiocyanaticus TaxID=585455 RepID=UPI001F4E49A4|nr:3'-5' exonuclease [Thiohalobacter thiocyanaticus]